MKKNLKKLEYFFLILVPCLFWVAYNSIKQINALKFSFTHTFHIFLFYLYKNYPLINAKGIS